MSIDNKSNFSEEINNTVEDLKEYINLRMQLIQLNVTEKVSIALSSIISIGTAIIFLVLFFIFGSFALSYLIGNYFENNAIGFGLLAGFYLLIGLLLLWLGKKFIRKRLINLFIDQFSNDEDDRK